MDIKPMPNIPIPTFDHLIQIEQERLVQGSKYHKRQVKPFMTFKLMIQNFKKVPEELFFQSQTLGFAFFKIEQKKSRRILIQNAIKIPQDEKVVVEVEINQVYPMITSPIVIIQMGDGATLLYVLNIIENNSHFAYYNAEVVNNQDIQKKNTEGFNSKKPPIYSFDSIPCKSTKDCMTSVEESGKWYRKNKKVRLQIDFDLKLYIRPSFIQFGSLISRSGLKNANIHIQLRYLEHTFKHLGSKLNSEKINFEIMIENHEIKPYWMLSDNIYDKQQNQNKQKRHQYYDNYKTGSFAFFQPDHQNIKLTVNKRDSKRDFLVHLGNLYFFPAAKGVFRGTLVIRLKFKPLNYSYEYFVQYEARVFGQQILYTEVFYEKENSQDYYFELVSGKDDPYEVDPLKSQCKQYRQALNLTEMALNLPMTDLDEDGNIIQQPKNVLGRRTRQSDEQIVKVQKIRITDVSTVGVPFLTIHTSEDQLKMIFHRTDLQSSSIVKITASTNIGLLSFSTQFGMRSLLCFTPQTIQYFRQNASIAEKSKHFCPNDKQKDTGQIFNLNQNGIFYISNPSQFPYRVVFKPPNVVFRLIFVQNVALTHGEIYEINHCSQNRGGLNCVWIYPRSVLKVRALLRNNVRSDPKSKSSEINYSISFVLDDIYTKGMRKWKSQGYRLSAPSVRKDKNYYILKFRHKIYQTQIEISPPQLYFQDIFMKKPEERLVTVTIRNPHVQNSIQQVKCPDSRVVVQNIDIISSKLVNMEELKVSLKIIIDLRRSLLSPSFTRIERQFADNIYNAPTLYQIFDWKRKQQQWKYFQENGLDTFESHIFLYFENKQSRYLPIRGKIRKLSIIQNRGDLLYGSKQIQQTKGQKRNRVLLRNQTEYPIVASLWLAPAQFGNLQVREHLGFKMKEFTKQTSEQMEKDLLLQSLPKFQQKCQQNPDHFSQIYKTDLNCMIQIQNKFGIQINNSLLQISNDNGELLTPDYISNQLQALNSYTVQLSNAEPKNYVLGIPSRGSKLLFKNKNNQYQPQPKNIQNISDLYFNSRINKNIVLRPNQQFTYENLLFYYPSHSEFNATLMVKNTYSQFEAIPIRAKPILLKVTPKYIGYFRCDFRTQNNVLQIPECKIFEEKYDKAFIEFSIKQDDLIRKDGSSSTIVSPMNHYHQLIVDLMKEQPIFGWFSWIKYDQFLPKMVRNQRFLMPRVTRKVIFQNQSGIFLNIKSISFRNFKCQDEFFVLLNCHRKQILQVEPMGQFQIVMYTKMESVFTHGISWLSIQTDKLEFDIQTLYSTDVHLLKLKNEFSSPPITIFYIVAISFSMFVSTFVTIWCIKLLIDTYREKMEAQSNFWNLVKVNEAANNDTIFWIQYKPFVQKYSFEVCSLEQKEKKNQKSQNAKNKAKKKKKNINSGGKDEMNLSLDQIIVSAREETSRSMKIDDKRVESEPENEIQKIEIKNPNKGSNFEETDSIGSSDTSQSFKIETRNFAKSKKAKKSRESSVESSHHKEFNRDAIKSDRKTEKIKIRRKDSTQSDQTLNTIKYKKKKEQEKKEEDEENFSKKPQTKPKIIESTNRIEPEPYPRHQRQVIIPANQITRQIPPPRNKVPSQKNPKYSSSLNKRSLNRINTEWIYDPSNPQLIQIPKHPIEPQQPSRYEPYKPVQYYQPKYQKKVKPSNPTSFHNTSGSKAFQIQEDFPELGEAANKSPKKEKPAKEEQKSMNTKGRWQSMIETISTLNKKEDEEKKREKPHKNHPEQSLEKKKSFLQDQQYQQQQEQQHQPSYQQQQQQNQNIWKQSQEPKMNKDSNIDDNEFKQDDIQNDWKQTNIWAQMVPVNDEGKMRERRYHSLFGSDSDDSQEQEDPLNELRQGSSKVEKPHSKYI